MSAEAGDRSVCGTLLHLGTSAAETVHGPFRVETFLNLSSRSLLLALCHGDVRGDTPLLARVHSSCMTSESFGGCDCDCAGQLDAALQAIAHCGRGAIFYLLQEGRGAGFIAKARDRMMVQASRDRVTTFDAYARMGLGRDDRRYDEVGFAAAALGVTAPLVLLTNNPEKVAALRRAAVAVDRVLPLEPTASPFNLHYLAAKSRSGHALSDQLPQTGVRAALPEAVAYFHPHPLTQRPRFVRVASYLLPIPARHVEDGAHWFRLHAYFDLTTQRERVVFTYGRDAATPPLVCVQRESLLARFPLRTRPTHVWWRAAVEHIANRGAGCALFVLHDDPAAGAAPGTSTVAEDHDLAWLLAQHVRGRRAQLLIEGAEMSPDDAAWRAALESQQVEIDALQIA